MLQVESPSLDDAFAQAIAQARVRLDPPPRQDRAWPAIAAAGLFALSALAFATTAILAPPAQLTPVTEVRGAI